MTDFVEVGGFRMPVLETMMDWALFWASQEIPVFPLHEVYSGICTCTCTKKCRGGSHKCGASCESKGKHPRWNHEDLPSGVENATRDFALIRRWWARWPTANIGGAMGGTSHLVALDFDPRHGGDLSLNDLIEAHGDAWTDTLTMKTGSGGFHFLFQYPPDQVLRNSAGEVGPGVDTRGEGGYIVLPPSIHASGNLYEMFRVVPVITAPVWLLQIFREKGAAKVVSFQAGRESRAFVYSGAARHFGVGKRNDGLRDVCLGRWLHAPNFGIETPEDLLRQLIEVRNTRCAFAPNDPPPDDEFLRDLVYRTVRNYARGVKGGAV